MLILNIIAIVVIIILSFRKEINDEILEEQEILNQNSNSNCNSKDLNYENEDIIDNNQTKISLNKHQTQDSTAKNLNDGLEMTKHNNQEHYINTNAPQSNNEIEEHKSIVKSQISIIDPTNIKNEFANVLENPNFHKILVV